MEQKKTLWIIAAVGVFLLVVLGAAMILYPPSARSIPAVATINPVDRIDNTNRVLPREDIRPVSDGFEHSATTAENSRPSDFQFDDRPPAKENPTLRVNDLFVVSENTTVYDVAKDSDKNGTTIDLNTLRNELQQAQPPVSNINITVNIPENDNKTVETQQNVVVVPVGESKNDANSSFKPSPKFDTKPSYKTDKSESKNEPKADSKKDNSSKVESKKTTATSSTKKTESKPAATKVEEPKKVTRFWVQVAAYSNKKTAENARSVLDENKIPADIFTYQDNKERLFYRVRVGPYTTKSEAEYWKAKIEKISEFAKAESYVTSSVD